MEAEDDMLVVIVGDENNDDSEESEKLVSVKEEPVDFEDSMTLEKFMETVEKHGKMVEIDINHANVKEEQSFVEEEDEEEEYVDEEFLQNDDDQSQGVFLRKRQKFYEDNSNQRHSMVKPEERKSLVDELRQSNPEYVQNPELLIEHLVDIMKSIKAPVPPDDYYYLNQKALYACFKCDKESDTLPAAGRHYQEKHGSRYLICFACGVDFRSTTNLYKHEKCCAAPDSVYVLKARARRLGRKGRSRPYLPSKEELEKKYTTKKYKKSDARPQWSCDACPARFRCGSALDAHRNLHAGRRPHRCAHCRAAYTSKSALLRHLAKHKDQVFICDHCGRTFKIKAALVAHMDTHKPERKHGCTQCGKRYSQRAAMLLHWRKQHLQLPPPFACQICDKRFARMFLLKVHMKDKHGMIIMTRKMFFKSLPTMTDSQVVEKAKLVFRSDTTYVDHSRNDDLTQQFLDSIQEAEFEEVQSIEEGEYIDEQETYVYEYNIDDHYQDTEGGVQDESQEVVEITKAEVQVQKETFESPMEHNVSEEIEIKEEHETTQDGIDDVHENVLSHAICTQETIEGILSERGEEYAEHHNIIVKMPVLKSEEKVVDKSPMKKGGVNCEQIEIPPRVLRRTKPAQSGRKMMVRITGTRLRSKN